MAGVVEVTAADREAEVYGAVPCRVFETLDRADIPCWVMDGYGGTVYDPNDVDCVIPADVLPRRLAALLRAERSRIGADVVRWYGDNHVVLASNESGGSPHFINLHLRPDYRRAGRFFYSGAEILESRRRRRLHPRESWVPATAIDFGCYLVEKIVKRCFGEPEGRRLGEAYRQDPAGCQRQVARFWGTRSTDRIIAAAASGNWDDVKRDLPRLRAELRRRAALRYPFWTAGYLVSKLARRAREWWTPRSGMHIILLGPDGAGKTTVQEAISRDLGPAFSGVQCRTFAPSLLGSRPTQGRPHALPPRSFPASVAKAIYWLLYYTLGYYLTVYPALARSVFVLNHRYLADALVDPKRYRYAAPHWILHLVWRLVPKPDLIILLDAPAEVVQARKKEVRFEETARQRAAYRSLVEQMPNGHIVDASRPIDEVLAEVNEIILRFLAARTFRRLGLD
jgi:thymidylate kinase